jgi:death-on-curing family protein
MVIGINEKIVNITHNYVVHKLVAVEGVLYSGTISGPINRIFSPTYGEPKYEGVKEKAGAILYSIVHGHSYTDGNKRTGLLTTCLFLMNNGYTLHVPPDTARFLEKMADALDPTAPSEADAIKWIKINARREFNSMVWYLMLILFCKLQGTGIIEAVTPGMLERDMIPCIDKEKLTDRTLKNAQKKQESMCIET